MVKIKVDTSVTSVSTSRVYHSCYSTTHRGDQSLNSCLWDVFQSSGNAALSCNKDLGCGLRLLTRLSSSSHKCSIGDRSGDRAGQGRTFMFCCCRYCAQTRATWHLALSCWKVWRFPCLAMNGWTIGLKISSRYLTPVRRPSTIFSSVWPQCLIQAHTITPPPPKRSHSCTHASE